MTFAEPIGAVPDWVRSVRDRPLIYMTLGTVVFERVDVFKAVVEGLGRLDADALVAVGPDGKVDALGPLLANVRAEFSFPRSSCCPTSM
ncbi:MAG: DUF1205 domain-containing protein [Actinobacteria bacterium]|nr:DUF1205 domain-containing protein [Actinomycetota bacterium]